MSTAIEEQIWNSAQLTQPVERARWRVWTYATPAVVLGRAQHALYDAVRQRVVPQMACVKRDAGGGAVLVGPWMVSVSVVLPGQHPWVHGSLIDSYQALGALHADVLRQHGVMAQALSPQDLPRALHRLGAAPPQWACFAGLSHGEVVDAEGRKLVGLAQRRRRDGVLLVAGTLVSRVPWSLLCAAMGHPQDESVLTRCTVSMEELLEQACAPASLAAHLDQQLRIALQDD